MGIYLNPDNMNFYKAVNSDIYVDKSLLIAYTNHIMNTKNQYVCISRPRRFGKTTDADMLTAYYSKGCDSQLLFNDLKIAAEETYRKHLNAYNVIHLNMQSFFSRTKNFDDMAEYLTRRVLLELKEAFPEVLFFDEQSFSSCLDDIYAAKHEQFVFIIDEWNCIFREHKHDEIAQKKYLDFLREIFKDKTYIGLVYMTGILPVKKYGSHSALNTFKEISMIDPTPLEAFMGFTNQEVELLCEQHQMDFQEMKQWYDGYHLTEEISIYSPRSVVYALMDKKFSNYWTSTETYEALQVYIDMNFQGLRDDIIELLAGKKIIINTSKFKNDMTTFTSKDDVFTLLVHLGYLGYHAATSEIYIPNNEVIESFVNSIEDSNWGTLSESLRNSAKLLQATLSCDSEKVADYIEKAHLETSILQYNDDADRCTEGNALAYTIYLAYIMARNDYSVFRELPTGKGFADIVYLPRGDKPAMVIELKYHQHADTAIKQIKEKKYYFGLEKYMDNLLLIGISYNKTTKKHTCIIEKYQRDDV